MTVRNGCPSIHRLVLLTWIGVYPVLTLIALVLEPWLSLVPVALRTLVMSLLMVPAMVYVVMPTMRRLFVDRNRRVGASCDT
ncbi:MAG: hypothetical protein QNJ91_11980 [Gammaproteobacteria bacterium]|nr:hypothetical protein [Gammaproteobacteria bacterium]